MRHLANMRSETRVVTLECAGNGRALLQPPTDGEKWQLGAVSTAEWTGVPLVEVLDRAGIKAGSRELVFRRGDQGTLAGSPRTRSFERGLRLDHARDPAR